jgi:cardiolipin synthase
MWKAISQAEHYVWVSTFIFEDDVIGRRTLEHLTRAALRGCSVVLVYDYFGSLGIKQSVFDDLRKAGGGFY